MKKANKSLVWVSMCIAGTFLWTSCGSMNGMNPRDYYDAPHDVPLQSQVVMGEDVFHRKDVVPFLHVSGDPLHDPGDFPDPNNGYAWDIVNVPRHGKYEGDRTDIGAYEYVPEDLQDVEGRYVSGSYINKNGDVVYTKEVELNIPYDLGIMVE